MLTESALVHYIAEVMGWKLDTDPSAPCAYRYYRGDKDAPTAEYWNHETQLPPNYLTDFGRVEETMQWLNDREYIVVCKQVPRGEGFIIDELTREETPPDFPALAELSPLGGYYSKEYRVMYHASIENNDIDDPRYWRRLRALGRTYPEALCRVIEEVLIYFPELRHLPEKGTQTDGKTTDNTIS